MKTKYLLIALLCMSLTDAFSQQLPFLALYRDNWNMLNPAALSNNYLVTNYPYTINASYRYQWFKVEDAPQTALINSEIVLEDYNIITGGHLIHDQTGKFGYTGAYGHFAYKIDFGRRYSQAVVIGLNAGMLQYRAKLSEIEFDQQELLALNNEQIYRFDFGLGAFYYYDDLFYAGLSIPQSLGIDTRFQSSPSEFELNRLPHLYLVVGGYFDAYLFGSDASNIEPSLWFRYVPNAPISIDINVRAQLSEVFWVGLGGGFSQTLRLDAGLAIGEALNFDDGLIRLGFSFGVPLARYRTAFGQSAEVHVVYSWE